MNGRISRRGLVAGLSDPPGIVFESIGGISSTQGCGAVTFFGRLRLRLRLRRSNPAPAPAPSKTVLRLRLRLRLRAKCTGSGGSGSGSGSDDQVLI